MASTLPPLKGAAFTFDLPLVSQADTDIFKTSPTLAAGDITVSKDGGNFNNITTLPTQIQSTGVLPIGLSATEMDADRVTVLCHDAAGSEWQDAAVTIYTTSKQFSDIPAAAPTVGAIADEVRVELGTELGRIDVAVSSVSAGGAGPITFTYTLTDTTNVPIPGCLVWATTDLAGANTVATGTTNDFGVVTFHLTGGTYYIWRKKAGYTFDDPDLEAVA